jgi:CubicO group peptidase (beta-lactamase class C family)
VATSTGIGFAQYLGEAVLEPLGLRATHIHGSAAWGAMGPLDDLLALGVELLAPTLVGVETLRHATEVAFPGLSGVLPGYGAQAHNDWGLGFELRDHKSPHWTGRNNSARTFGHFGRSGAFIWVDPAVGLACAGLADQPFGPWAIRAWPPLADAVLAEFRARR